MKTVQVTGAFNSDQLLKAIGNDLIRKHAQANRSGDEFLLMVEAKKHKDSLPPAVLQYLNLVDGGGWIEPETVKRASIPYTARNDGR